MVMGRIKEDHGAKHHQSEKLLPSNQFKANGPRPPRRDWRDWFIMTTVTSGVSYGLYTVAKVIATSPSLFPHSNPHPALRSPSTIPTNPAPTRSRQSLHRRLLFSRLRPNRSTNNRHRQPQSLRNPTHREIRHDPELRRHRN